MTNCKAFAWLLLPLLALANLFHLPWTVWLTLEQLQTGWGYSTNMEMGVLYPWLTELLLLPVILLALILLIFAAVKKQRGGILGVDLAFLLLLLAQYGVTNLFIHT